MRLSENSVGLSIFKLIRSASLQRLEKSKPRSGNAIMQNAHL
jgi:hypothetical protein